MQTVEEVIKALNEVSAAHRVAGMKRFGIDTTHAIGVSIPLLRGMAKKIKKNHALALGLWATGMHEARILASMIDDPAMVTPSQINAWAKDFNSWDLCDQVCGNLFDRTPYAVDKAKEFSHSKKEYVKRTAFTLMAEYAVHNKKAGDKIFIEFLTIIEREAYDGRNFVTKAVNWALRGIGKRNKALHAEAIVTAKRILQQDSKAAKWVASNALKELEGEAVKKKFIHQ